MIHDCLINGANPAYCVLGAAKGGHFKLLRLCLDSFNIHISYLYEALGLACKNKRIDIVNRLIDEIIKKYNIDYHRESKFPRIRCPKILITLLKRLYIQPKYFKMCLRYYRRHHNYKMLAALKEHFPERFN